MTKRKTTGQTNTTTEASDIFRKITWARSFHSAAVSRMNEWEKLYKGAFSTPKAIGDAEAQSDTAPPGSSTTVFKPAKGRAIVQKMLALLSLRAQMRNQVVPLKEGSQAEEAACTLLEQFLEGYQFRVTREVGRPIFRHAVQWALLRGKMVLQAQFSPSLVDSEFFPIRTIVPDPITVYEMPARTGIAYIATEEWRYVWDLRREINLHIETGQGAGGAPQWKMFKETDSEGTALPDNQQLSLQTYWDDEVYAVYVGSEEVLPPTKHNYGFLPFAIAYVEDTPFVEPEWKGQSVLAPIMDALKSEAALLSTLADAAESYFWPIGVWQSTDGRCGWISPSAASIQAIPADAKVTFYNPAPNIATLEAYKSWLDEEIQMYTLPALAFAVNMPGVNQQSGFAVAQVLSQIQDKIQDKKTNLEIAFGEHFGQVLRLTEEFAKNAEGGKLQVMAMESEGVEHETRERRENRERGGGRGRRMLVGVGADDVGGHHTVLTHISPTLPTEKMSLLQQAKAMRERDPLTKRPLVDDKTIREIMPEVFDHPDKINARIDEEYYAERVPEIQQWEQEEFMAEWRKSHKPHVDMAEMNPDNLSKPELAQRLRMAEMYIRNPKAFMEAMMAQSPVNSEQSTVNGALPGRGGPRAGGEGMPNGPMGGPGPMLPPAQMQAGGVGAVPPGSSRGEGQSGQLPPGIMPAQMQAGGVGAVPPGSSRGEGQSGQLPPGIMPPQMQTGNPNPLQGQDEQALIAEQMAKAGRPPRT